MKPDAVIDTPCQQRKYHWTWSAVSAIVVLLTGAFRYALPNRDGDLWWHMLYGKYLLAHKTLIPDHTIFSWTPSTNETIYCTWLPDIFLYFIHQAFGLTGLFAFRYACLLFFIIACFLFARKLFIANNPVVWLCILIGILMGYAAIYIKPEIFSFALMTMIVWTWWHIKTGGDGTYRWCYAIPIIMLIWVNSHGAFVFGYIFIFSVAVGEILNSCLNHGNLLTGQLRKHFRIAIGVSLLVPFINPYGWRYPLQLFASLIPTEANLAYNNKIAAYLPTFKLLTPFHAFGLYANLSILILATLYVINLKRRKTDWASLLTNLVFALLYTRFLRTTFFFAPVFAFSAMVMIKTIGNAINVKRQFIRDTVFPLITLILIISISSDAIHTGYTQPEDFAMAGEFGVSFRDPFDSAEFIKQNLPHSKIGNTYAAGSYLLWKLWPDSKVMFDSRHFPYKDWSDEYFDFLGGNNFRSFLIKYPSDLWCISHGSPQVYNNFIYSEDWKLAFYGRGASVFVPKEKGFKGGKAYEVARDINIVRTPSTLNRIFIFAVNIFDWSTAELLIDRIKSQSDAPENEPQFVALNNIIEGMKAFEIGDYDKTVDMLWKSPKYLKGLEIILAVSHSHLAQKYLDLSQFEKARSHSYVAMEVLPGSVVTLYNVGVVDWLAYEKTSEYHIDEIKKSYEKALGDFIHKSKNGQNFDSYAKISQRILSGKHIGPFNQPKLYIPQISNSVQ